DLYVVDLATGTEAPTPPPPGVDFLLHRRPAPSPDGRRVLTQARAFVGFTFGSDDIWRYEVP
ncbi:MAG: hypothetical protein ACREME_13355, partial [Gemmatimonadales bacterium]